MMKFLIKYYVRKELLNLKGSKLGQILRLVFADSITNYCAPSVVESFLRRLSLGATDHAAVHVGHGV